MKTQCLLRLFWTAGLVLPDLAARAGAVFTSLHSFQVFSNGAFPTGELVRGSDGNFYGTTGGAGMNNQGTVFKITPHGALTSLYSFTGGNDGGSPNGLVLGGDGNFYGTTSGGGTNGAGTVFKISPNGALTSLYSFKGAKDGAAPRAGLVEGSDGGFYGTTSDGGPNGLGTVFKVSPDGVLTSLYSFTGGNDGAHPGAAPVQGKDGNFYGTTSAGGTNNLGTAFKISTNGLLTSLYSFGAVQDLHGNALDGDYPSGLVQGNDGNFYGTTSQGGTNGIGLGTVFKLSPNGLLTTLHSFGGDSLDGWAPMAGLVQGTDGSFYGTTVRSDGENYGGTVFKITSDGALTILYSFTGGNDGARPQGRLVQGGDGNFYGTTSGGGTDSTGTVFKISPEGALSSLYSFTGINDGFNPRAGLVQGSDGSFYGTTWGGGPNGVLPYGGYGTVFKLSPNGELTTLYSFPFIDGNGREWPWPQGRWPTHGLVQGKDGTFYGTTDGGGTNGVFQYGGSGTVFKISPDGALTSSYSFTGGRDGGGPNGLVQGSDGNFYGTTYNGGTNNLGTVFKISPDGALTGIYSFTGGKDGANPQAGLVQGSDGNFYGTADGGTNNSGTVFKISPNGELTSFYSFSGGADGGGPNALVQGSDGNLYGTTWSGGAYGSGTVFKISANGELTSLYSFGAIQDLRGNALDGENPSGGLLQASDGNFYGMTWFGGTNGGFEYVPDPVYGHGTVFRISPNGVLTSLYSFTGGIDGARPQGGLVQGSDGSFYGTTGFGGRGGGGTVFRLTVTPEPPQLAISRAGPNVMLMWPTNYAGYRLESIANLGGPGWTTVNLGGMPTVLNGQFVLGLPTTNAQQLFYRLSSN